MALSWTRVDPDSGMSVSIEMLSVMVDLESQSMYNRSMTSYMDMLSIDTEMVWSGTDVMVTTSIGAHSQVKIQAHPARSGGICLLTLRRPSEPLRLA